MRYSTGNYFLHTIEILSDVLISPYITFRFLMGAHAFVDSFVWILHTNKKLTTDLGLHLRKFLESLGFSQFVVATTVSVTLKLEMGINFKFAI